MANFTVEQELPTDANERKLAKEKIENLIPATFVDLGSEITLQDSGANVQVVMTNVQDHQAVAMFRKLANRALLPESGFGKPLFTVGNPLPANEQNEFTA